MNSAIASASDAAHERFALAEQVDTLVLAGVDAIMLETFRRPSRWSMAIHVATERGRQVPVIAMMVFDAQGMADGRLGRRDRALG